MCPISVQILLERNIENWSSTCPQFLVELFTIIPNKKVYFCPGTIWHFLCNGLWKFWQLFLPPRMLTLVDRPIHWYFFIVVVLFDKNTFASQRPIFAHVLFLFAHSDRIQNQFVCSIGCWSECRCYLTWKAEMNGHTHTASLGVLIFCRKNAVFILCILDSPNWISNCWIFQMLCN